MSDIPPMPAPDSQPGSPIAPEPPAEPPISEVAAAPATEPKAGSVTPKRRRKGMLIAVASIGGVIAIILGVFLFLLTPPTRAEFNDPVDAGTRSTNAALYASLIAAGITDPFVDTNEERAYVAYALPNGSVAQADTFQRFVIGSAADASPGSEYIYAFQYVGKTPSQLWIVKMSDFLAYVAGELSASELDAKIQKASF